MTRTILAVVLLVSKTLPAFAEDFDLPNSSRVSKAVHEMFPKGHTEPTGYWTRNHAHYMVEAGWEAWKKKKYNEAIKYFLSGISLDVSNASAYFGVAYVCSVQANYPDAIYFYRKALKYEKNYAPIYANLAKAISVNGDKTPEVAELLEKAVTVDPKCGDAWWTYAGYLAEHDDWKGAGEKASRALQCGVKVDPKFINEIEKHGGKVDRADVSGNHSKLAEDHYMGRSMLIPVRFDYPRFAQPTVAGSYGEKTYTWRKPDQIRSTSR